VRESTDDAQIEGDIFPVSARIGGTVKSVLVADNQYVEAGTVLVEIDPTDYEVAARRAEADLADAQSNAKAEKTGVPIAATTTQNELDSARANVNAAQKEVDAANAKLQEATANHNKAAADLTRYQALVAKDEVSRQQYDAVVAQEAGARAAVDSARAAVASAESHVAQAQAAMRSAGTAPQQVAVTQARAGGAEAGAARAQAALEQAKLNLQYTTVRAPAAGIVSKKSVEPGQVIQPGQPLIAIVPLQNLWVVANFKENQLKDMHPGQKAKVHVDAYDKDYDGHVDSIGGATAARFSVLPPENATGNYVKVVQRVPVKIVFDPNQDPEHRLRPGLSVVPTVLTK
ncbi:MAG TPA: HlyD family secretion protein, partial [Terriglobales bacterium]|nr:HlyD family secretion protein [Terriglobales bacterium]